MGRTSGTDDRGARAHVELRPERVLLVLAAIAIGLALVGVVAGLAVRRDPDGHLGAVARRLLLDEEATLPAYAGGALWAAVATLLAARAARERRRHRGHGIRWAVLALAAAVASVDEVVDLHGPLIDLARGALAGPALALWTAAAGGTLLVLVTVALPVVRGERARYAWLLGAALLGFGVLGIELAVGPTPPPERAPDAVIVAGGLEEGFELLGVSLLAYAALAPFAGPDGRVRVTIGPSS